MQNAAILCECILISQKKRKMGNTDMGRLNEDRVESIVQLILDDYTDERAVNKTVEDSLSRIL